MSFHAEEIHRLQANMARDPQIIIMFRPIAPPSAMGLASFVGSTFIVGSWIANWWGDASSPTTFFPFVTLWGGLARFIAGIYVFQARDTLVPIVYTMWGAFWLAIGLLYLLATVDPIPATPNSRA